jgi:hypothetical protein
MPGCCGPGGITGCPHAGFSPPGGYAWAMVQMLPQEKVVRCLVQASKQSIKQASKHPCMHACNWPLLTTGSPWKLLNTKPCNSSPFSSSSSSAIPTRETKQRHQTHTPQQQQREARSSTIVGTRQCEAEMQLLQQALRSQLLFFPSFMATCK